MEVTIHALDHGPANFDIVASHYCIAYQGDPGDPDAEEKKATFKTLLADFESREGRSRSQFWCENIQAAAMLTDKDRFFSAGDGFSTSADLPLASLVSQADRLARMAEEFLGGPPRRTTLELVFGIETDVFQCLDKIAAKKPIEEEEATQLRSVYEAKAREDLAVATDYVERAAQRRAQLIYLQGMLLGLGALAFVTGSLALAVKILPNLLPGTESVPMALFVGGLGGVVSVMQRLTQGQLRARLDLGETTVRILGAFRPVIGGLLALAIVLLVLGGIVPLDVPADLGTRAFFIAGISFLAGFSERFAQDMIGAGRAAAVASGVGPV